MIYIISFFLALSMSAIEAVSYPGFAKNHIGVNAQLFYIVSMIMSTTKMPEHKLVLKTLQSTSILLAISYVVLIFLEKGTYPNFVYTKTHINLLTYLFLVAITWFHYLRVKKLPLIKSLLIASLIYVCADGIGQTLEVMFRELRRIANNPFATYEQKMDIAYPGFYSAMKEMVKLTPPSATILIPPQGHPWELEGNGAMVTYFIYPRKAINLISGDQSQFKPGRYIMIANGSWRQKNATEYGWPKIPIKSDKLIKIDLATHENYTINRDFDPIMDKWDWGLIEVPHE